MSGAFGGVQKLIQDKQPLAVYVHCAAQNLYAFFRHSIRQWELLSYITGESAFTLNKLNPTRWAGRLSSLMGIKHRYMLDFK